MKSWLGWIVFTLISAVILHVGGVMYIPSLMTTLNVNAIAKRRGAEWQVNKINTGRLRFAGTDLIVQDNPDTITAMAMYDVTEKPIRVHCVIPETDNYWSISLFAWNTDNFYVLNDKQAKSKEFDLVIVKENSKYKAKEGEIVVVAQSPKGVILFRLIVTDRHNQTEVDQVVAVQSRAKIEVIENAE